VPDAETLYRQGLISDAAMDRLRDTMTHQAEGANPAGPYIDTAKQYAGRALGFASGGLTGAGVDVLPDWMNRLGGIFQNPDNQAAIGGGVGSGVGKFTNAQLKALADKGMNSAEIAQELGVSRPAVSKRAQEAGVTFAGKGGRPRVITDEKLNELLDEGMNFSQVASRLQTTPAAVSIRAASIGRKPAFSKNPANTDTVNTEWVALPDGTLGRRTGRAEDLR